MPPHRREVDGGMSVGGLTCRSTCTCKRSTWRGSAGTFAPRRSNCHNVRNEAAARFSLRMKRNKALYLQSRSKLALRDVDEKRATGRLWH